jgi:hypothetical protein
MKERVTASITVHSTQCAIILALKMDLRKLPDMSLREIAVAAQLDEGPQAIKHRLDSL